MTPALSELMNELKLEENKMSVTLKDLHFVHPAEHDGATGFMRPATVADLREVLLDLGAEETVSWRGVRWVDVLVLRADALEETE